jgi:hypothetical protein
MLFALRYQDVFASDVCGDYFSCYNFPQDNESIIPVVTNEITGQEQASSFAISQDCISANSGCQISLSDTPDETENGSGDSIIATQANPKKG